MINIKILKYFEKIKDLEGLPIGELRDELFYLHNQVCEPKEFGKSCMGCVLRTMNKLKEYHSKLLSNSK